MPSLNRRFVAVATMPRPGAFAEPRQANRIRADYREMPGLALTIDQAARLWQMERELAGTVLRQLIREGFLREALDHRFVRA